MGIENLWNTLAEVQQLENQAESMLDGSLAEVMEIIRQAAGL